MYTMRCPVSSSCGNRYQYDIGVDISTTTDTSLSLSLSLSLRCLAGKVEKKGPHHLDVAECYVHLSDVYAKQDLWPEALELLEDALAIQQDKLRPSDRVTGETLGKMGSASAHIAGRLDEAIDYHDRSISAVLETHGVDDSSLIPSYFSMGKIHRERGDHTNAMISLKRALTCIVKIGHPGERDVLVLMAQTAAASGQQDQALVYLKKCHAFLCKTAGKDAQDTLDMLATVSSIERSLA